MKSRTILLFLLLIFGLGTSGCGIKPDRLDPPPNSEGQEFPATYPAPATLHIY